MEVAEPAQEEMDADENEFLKFRYDEKVGKRNKKLFSVSDEMTIGMTSNRLRIH